ncbi:MAG: DNA repair protein RadC [Treponema sp.]|nr:DNA repair protein RadC [Treponema sp.]
MRLPSKARPREKLMDKGVNALSDRELLAILLNTDIKSKEVWTIAGDLLEHLDVRKGIPDVRELVKITGLGEGKSCSIVAMLEFGRRQWGIVGIRVRQPKDVFNIIKHYADRKQERFICLSLNGAHEVLAVRVVTIGLVNKTMVHPREVFADPILDRASAVIAAHNHPSGQLVPSSEDNEITERLRAAADVLGLNFLDHIIFSETAYFSYQKDGRFT